MHSIARRRTAAFIDTVTENRAPLRRAVEITAPVYNAESARSNNCPCFAIASASRRSAPPRGGRFPTPDRPRAHACFDELLLGERRAAPHPAQQDSQPSVHAISHGNKIRRHAHVPRLRHCPSRRAHD
jgi:hypothetical protein